MKVIHTTAVLITAIFALLSMGCGEYPDDIGEVSGQLSIPRAILAHDVRAIQIIAIKGKRSASLGMCQSDALANGAFSKSDMVKFFHDGNETKSYVKSVTASELDAGVTMKVEVETGTNYMFIVEVIAASSDGMASQVVANGSGAYEKVAKGSNKALNISLTEVSPALSCFPLIN